MKIEYNKEFKLLIIENSFLPVKGYKLMNFLGLFILKRKGTSTLTNSDLIHEKIHTKQILELLIFGFYFLYILNWILVGFNYDKICFEKESYENDNNSKYLNKRKLFGFLRYI